MNKKIIVFSIVTAMIFGIYIYTLYIKEKSNDVLPEMIYFIQIGAYKNSDNVAKMTKLTNYNYVEKEDGIYYIYIAITKDEEVLEKLKKLYYDKDVYIKKKEITNTNFLEYLSKYDSMLKETNDKELIEVIQKDILKKYEKIV